MSEWSKKVGEHGEGLVERLLEIIGWTNPEKGIDILCSNAEDHKRPSAKGSRREHGIDFLHFHKSPLFSNTLKFHCISSKYKASEPYPANPHSLFKEHLTDISQAVDCFAKSSESKAIKKEQTGVSNTSYAGVLIWLHNTKTKDTDAYDDLLSKVSNIQLPKDSAFNYPIYLVDNKQANFIFDCDHFMNRNFADHEVSFFYQKTGTNENSPDEFLSSGAALPVELVTSELLIYRTDRSAVYLSGQNSTSFCILTLEKFSEDGLRKIIGLAHDITSALPSDIHIAFEDYNELHHKDIVNRVKMGFDDNKLTGRVFVHSLNENFHNLRT